MATLDLIVIVVLLVSMLIGCFRGFVYEAITLLGWVVAFFVARWLTPDVAQLFQGSVGNESFGVAIVFGAIFIAVLFLNGVVAFVLKGVFSKGALRPVDRSLGGVFGILRGVICLLLLTLFVHLFGVQNEPWWAQSKSAFLFDEAMQMSKPFLRDVLDFDQDKFQSDLNERIKEGLQENMKDKVQEAVHRASENSKTPAGKNAVPAQE